MKNENISYWKDKYGRIYQIQGTIPFPSRVIHTPKGWTYISKKEYDIINEQRKSKRNK